MNKNEFARIFEASNHSQEEETLPISFDKSFLRDLTYNMEEYKNMTEDIVGDINTVIEEEKSNIRIYKVDRKIFPDIWIPEPEDVESDDDYPIYPKSALLNLLKEYCAFFITYESNNSGHLDLNVWKDYEEWSMVLMSFEFV